MATSCPNFYVSCPSVRPRTIYWLESRGLPVTTAWHAAARCCTQLYVAARCYMMLRADATWCCTLMYAAARCCTLLHAAARCCTLLHDAARWCYMMLHADVRCCTLLHDDERCCTLLHDLDADARCHIRSSFLPLCDCDFKIIFVILWSILRQRNPIAWLAKKATEI